MPGKKHWQPLLYLGVGGREKKTAPEWRSQMIPHLSLGLNSCRLIISSTPHTSWHRFSAAPGNGLELGREPQGAR